MFDPLTLARMGDQLLSAGNAEDAVVAYVQALKAPAELATDDWTPVEWARTVCQMAKAILQRADRDPSANIEEAIDVCKGALAWVAPDELTDVLYFPAGRVTIASPRAPRRNGAMLFHQLGSVYLDRLEGDRSENVEIALRAYRQALAWTNRDTEPVDWGVEAMSLATTFAFRLEGDPEQNIKTALELLDEAVDVFATEGDRERWAATATNLARTCLQVSGSERAASVERAIDLFKDVLETRPREREPLGWASTSLGLAHAYLVHAEEADGESAAKAIQLCENVLSEPALQRTPSLRAEAFQNLGMSLRALPDGSRAANAKRAAKAFRDALDTLPPAAGPELRGAVLRELANLYFDEGRWAKAEPLFADAIAVETALLQTAVYEAGRRAQVSSDLHPRHAYCLLRLRKYDEALVQLEAGKARLLAFAVALTAARLGALDSDLREALVRQNETIRDLASRRGDERSRDRLRTKLDDAAFGAALATAREELKDLLAEVEVAGLSLEEILALAPQEGALVAPVFTSRGSAVFVIPHGGTAITAHHVLWLRDFTTADLNALLEKLTGASESAIEDVTEALWDWLGAKIVARLHRLRARRILFLPQGGLGLFPVHAAWRQVNGERRYFADDVEITYAPSALALDTARRRAADGRDRTALVAGVAKSEQFGDLESVSSEVKAVAALFGTEPLPDSDATVATILRRGRDVSYLHLACHGAFGWGTDPLDSALYLADDQPLSLADVIGRLDLKVNPLVTLSACESGVVEGSESPDEFYGLMAGFMQAGASGVLSSLWRVDDMSTGLLMERFYRNLLAEAMEPAAALREAQQWLRGLTREELGRKPEGRNVLLFGRRDDRPYATPYHWAAFTYNGV